MSNQPSRRFVVSLLAAFVLIALASPPVRAEEPGASRPPNVVILFADDLGYGDLACYGGPDPTPHLDRLAADGMRFTDFYVAQAVCSASRAALLTGRYPHKVGIKGALDHRSRHGLPAAERTLAEVLKGRGYATAIYGKWHLGHLPEHLPTRHGFDEYYGLPYSNDMWPKHPTGTYPDLPLVDGERTVELNPDQSKLTGEYTRRAVDFIGRNKDRPFFLYVPYAMPHVPLFVPDAFKGKSKARGLYGDVVMEIDWSAGEVVAALERHGLTRDTVVIFTSDNGPWLSYGDHAGSAGPLREGKGTAFDGGVRVPAIVKWPGGRVPAGAVCAEPVMTIDLLPTLAKFAGAERDPADPPLDGRDIGALLRGEAGAKSPHGALRFYWGGELHAVRGGRFKLHLTHDYTTVVEPGSGGKPGKTQKRRIGVSLFDLCDEVGEQTDVSAKHPDVVEHLTRAGQSVGPLP